MDRGYALNRLYVYKIIKAVLPALSDNENRHFGLNDTFEDLWNKAKEYCKKITKKKKEKQSLIDECKLDPMFEVQLQKEIETLRLFFEKTNVEAAEETDEMEMQEPQSQQPIDETDDEAFDFILGELLRLCDQPSPNNQTNVNNNQTNVNNNQHNNQTNVNNNSSVLQLQQQQPISTQAPTFINQTTTSQPAKTKPANSKYVF